MSGHLGQLPARPDSAPGITKLGLSESTIASGTSTKSVTFANAFFVGTASLLGSNSKLPTVGITADNMQSGDYFTLSNVSATGFDVAFFNSSDTGIDRNFRYSAVGYGKEGS